MEEKLQAEIEKILRNNATRIATINSPFDPVTGEGSIGLRKKVVISDFPTPTMWLPTEMLSNKFVSRLLRAKTVTAFMQKRDIEDTAENRDLVVEMFIRIRIRYDFPFWAAVFVRIKPKDIGGDFVPFRLRPSQRKLVEEGFGNLAVLDGPVRLIILKARQWGGSTCTQLFMAWLQLVHRQGLNSLIIAQGLSTATEIQEMFRNAIEHYPIRLLHPMGETYSPTETKWAGVGAVQIHQVPQRKCKIKIGSVERPDSCRGGDYNFVHCSEVGVWKKTLGKEPEDIIDAATGGMGLEPMTMIVYESTAKGTGNFFHREWLAAKEGRSQFKGIFIPWYDVPDRYWLDFADDKKRMEFTLRLYKNRDSDTVMSDREEPGKYLWWLWTKGATLEGIHWYVAERSKYREHGHMASEYPSDDVEAFVHSGTDVFNKYDVDKFRDDCRAPLEVGDVVGKAVRGDDALQGIHFVNGGNGLLWVWSHPETFEGERVINRYLVTVDIGGRWRKADWSVICVLDRYEMMEGGRPVIVAQWRGHIDHDLLAWKAAQVAAYYDNALLVIESNTIDREKDTDDGDLSGFILNQIKEEYPNLYARSSTDQQAVVDGSETRYGFHTNSKTKPEIIALLIECVREHLYVERDMQCLDEYLIYELADGKYQAAPGTDHHDDLLMTRAIGLWVCFREMERPYFVKTTELHRTATSRIM